MEYSIGIIICGCMCLLFVAELAFLGMAIYLKKKISIVLHTFGTIISLLISVLLIAFMAKVNLSIESNSLFIIVIIASIIFFIAFSIKSFFEDTDGIDFRIKKKREMLKQIKKQKDDEKSDKVNSESDKVKKESVADKENQDSEEVKESEEHKDDDSEKQDGTEENTEEMPMIKRTEKRSHKKNRQN